MNYQIAPALERGLTILEMLAQAEKSLGFNEIAQVLELSKSSTARLLRVLRERGYAMKSAESGRYIPGPRMANLGQRTPTIDRLRSLADKQLSSLTKKTSNTTMLLYWDGEQVQSIAKKNHPISIPMQEVGSMNHELISSPWGWVFYESLDVQKRRQVWSQSVVKIAKRTVSDGLIAYRKNGYAYTDQLFFKTIRRLAAPIYDQSNTVIGAVAVGGNVLTMTDKQVEIFGRFVVECANEISMQLGHPKNL